MKLEKHKYVVLITKRKYYKGKTYVKDWSDAYNGCPGYLINIDTESLSYRPYLISFTPWISGSLHNSNTASFSANEFRIVSKKKHDIAYVKWKKRRNGK